MMTVDELIDFVNGIEELGSTPMGKGPDVPDHLSIYTRREMELLAKYARQIPKHGTAVEIGVYVGHTASILLNLQEELDLKIALIDNWSWMMPDAKASFEKMMDDQFPQRPYLALWMTSREASELWSFNENPIHFIHIDACHDRGEDGVDQDCKMWLPRLVHGGFAAFHDVDHPPVMQTVEEFCSGWAQERSGRTLVAIKP